MSELAEIQRDIAASLRAVDESAHAQPWLLGDADLIRRRLGIYRANTAASIAKALAAAYPVVRQLVGEEFFDGLARECQREIASTSGDLNDYGAEFAAFVAAFAHTQSLPYLPDLARLEWAVHGAYGAADAQPWEAASLMAVAPAQQASLRFEWAAGTALIASSYPIARIWAIHQADHAGEFNVDWSVAEHALVARDGHRVIVRALGAGEAAFISASLRGEPLGVAATAALEAEPNFDLGTLLSSAVASNLITGFRIIEGE